jgi:predicted RNA-binding Zn ribbon-like protein
MDTAYLEELIEYKVAPEPLVAIQGLLNTHDYEKDEELLGNPGAARQWLNGAGLVQGDEPVSDEEFDDLIELRRILRGILATQSKGEVDRDLFQELQALANKHPAGYDVSEAGDVTLCLKPVETAGELIGQLVGIVGMAQDLGWWRRLKICAADDCRWAFYDSSKNRGGTWCRMEVCGNRSKNRRYRGKA